MLTKGPGELQYWNLELAIVAAPSSWSCTAATFIGEVMEESLGYDERTGIQGERYRREYAVGESMR